MLIEKTTRYRVLFEDAAESYLQHGGEARYLPKIIDYFRGLCVADICPGDVKQMAMDLFPNHLPGSRNRQAITPTRAVLYHAHDMGWREPLRVRQFRAQKSKFHQPVDAKWLQAFLTQCDEDGLQGLAACVLFMNHTAARVSEAIGLLGEHVDMRRRTALLVKTKTEVKSTRYLTDELMFRFYNLGFEKGKRVFGYGSRYSINERIKAVCRRAGVIYRPSHSVGRHSFATNALNLGIGVRTAMDAGGWKSSVVFLETYSHTENAGRMVADAFNRERYTGM